jgi:DNA (cytosine-5)-methyltransferase 1
MEYLSCFSGIGGLEVPGLKPSLCEIDPNCRSVLKKTYPKSKIYEDINEIEALKFNLICGGWPCQDISVAGKQRGLSGENSGLFYRFLEIAKIGNASTLVAENVPNLLKLQGGEVFREVLRLIYEAGFSHISWRSLNARWFQLPHHRNRIFLVASKNRDVCLSLLRPLPLQKREVTRSSSAGFYWTAGTHSLNYSVGYVPTLKIGSSVGIPSPPAVHYGDVVRPLSWQEAIKLQGFSPEFFLDLKPGDILKMAGNAVAKPVGAFVMSGVVSGERNFEPDFKKRQSDWLIGGVDEEIPINGYFDGAIHEPYLEKAKFGSCDLDSFLDFQSNQRLSIRAASGLLQRLDKSGIPCPEKLVKDLLSIRDQGVLGGVDG